jgi:hypothetical protein
LEDKRRKSPTKLDTKIEKQIIKVKDSSRAFQCKCVCSSSRGQRKQREGNNSRSNSRQVSKLKNMNSID